MKSLYSSSLVAIALAGLSAPALAQEAPGASESEIVVTAQRREERLVDVPISVANLSAAALSAANVDELVDIVNVTPGVRFDFSGGFFQPTIRGVGTAITTSGGGSNVGIYTDGFYSPNPLSVDFDLMKVRSIQVLKGPQGTLFGRNTTGGAILVQTAEPSQDASAEVRASYGRYNEMKLQAYATTGLGEGVAVDIEGLLKKGDGWLRALNTNQRLGKYENWSVRTGLKIESGDVSALLRYTRTDIDDPTSVLDATYFNPSFGSGKPNFAVLGTTATHSKNRIAIDNAAEYFRAKTDVVQLTIKADLGFADLTSYSQYRHEDVDSSIDLDHSGVPIFQLGLPNNNRTTSQELLLTSKPGGALTWTAGLFWFSNKDQYITHIDNAGLAPKSRIRLGGSSSTTKSLAAFVDMTYEVTSQLFLTAGARWAKDKVSDSYWNTRFLAPSYVDGNGQTVAAPRGQVAVPGISDDRVTPRFVIRYKPDDTSSIYASYTKGYKAAIIDVGGSCQNAPLFTCNPVNPESIDAFEAGYKYSSGPLNFEASAFYYDYKNLQVSLFLAGQASIINAAKSEIYGLDGSLRYDITDGFTVNLGAAWTHGRYKKFVNAPIYVNCAGLGQATLDSCNANGISYVVLGQNLTNVKMQRTPEFTGNVGANYRTDLGGGELALSGNWYFSSKFFFGPSGTQFPQGAYDTLSLRAQWTDPSDTFMVALWGNNVTNSRYLTGAQYNNFAIGANWNKPATYGLELGVRF
ncbi:MAG TPA: TonB-dependent receptor [Novosphingobium sp.]|nr:TonB-dependent receptor [Novosphingobium sp.]